MKILITGGKSSPSYKILKAFEGEQIILADYGELPSFSPGSCQLLSLGEKNEETIAHQLLNACLDHEVNMLLPLHEFEVLAVSKAALLFSEFDIEVLLPAMVEIPEYFYPQEAVKKGHNWAVFRHGELLYSPAPDDAMSEKGLSKKLNGAFYIPENPEGVTAILYTIA